MKITAFDSTTLRALRPQIDAALSTVADKYGIKLSLGKISFAGEYFTAKLEGALIKDGVATSKEAEQFKRFAQLYGLVFDDLGKTFVCNGKTFTITGLATTRSKRPVLAQADGKTYLFEVQAINRLLGRNDDK